MAHIDLNADLGESFGPWPMGDDAAMLGVVTSANIACGFHAGDPAGILRTLREAAARGVSVGAHIGYRDLAGFGRRNLQMGHADLMAETIYQIGALQALARAAGTRVSYVKPHGALYNTIAHDKAQAAAVIEGILAVDPHLPLMALAGAPVVGQARAAGLGVIAEGFADRGYLPDGRLVPRGTPGATIHDPDEITARILRLVQTGHITALDGTDIPLSVQSICVHGDNPEAVTIARALRAGLEAGGVTLRAVTTP